MVDSFNLNLPGNTNGPLIGWPILPHGHGSFYNVFGSSINSINSVGPTPAEGYSYASYLPGTSAIKGEIKACSINYCHRSLSNSYRVLVINYSTGNFALVTTHPSGLVDGNSTSLVLPPKTIPISGGDYIGICVHDTSGSTGNPSPQIAIEGTVHFTLDLS